MKESFSTLQSSAPPPAASEHSALPQGTPENHTAPGREELNVRELKHEESLPYTRVRSGNSWLSLDLREVWRFRELLLALATRDIKLRYRQTALGAIWVVLQPLMAAGVLTIVFDKVARLDTNFTIVFGGLLGWNVFSSTFSKASSCILGNSGLVGKVYFPRLVLPLSVVFSVLLDFLVAFAMMVVLMILNRVTPGIEILLLPVWLFFLVIMALGLGLIVSALMVRYRDVGYALPVFLNLMLYASPVAYPLSEALERIDDEWQYFFYLNPLISLIEGIRWSLLGIGELQPSSLLYSIVFSVGILFFGLVAFERQKRWFADVI